MWTITTRYGRRMRDDVDTAITELKPRKSLGADKMLVCVYKGLPRVTCWSQLMA